MEAKSDKNEPVTLAPIVYVQKIKEKIDQIVEKRAAAGQTVTQEKLKNLENLILKCLAYYFLALKREDGLLMVFQIQKMTGML